MGLLNKVKNLKEKKTEITSKGQHKEDDNKKINHDVIKDHHKKQIKKEEKKGIIEPQHNLSTKNAKLQVKRPIGSAKEAALTQTADTPLKSSVKHFSNRTHVGIPGLDDVMEGGFKTGSVNLIGGGAGSGKSIFCMQFLVEGIRKHNENGIYISFEQSPKHIIEDFERFGWGLKKLVKDNKLELIYISPEQVQTVLKTGAGSVLNSIKKIKAKRLVLDSLTAFTLLQKSEYEKRREVLKLIEAMQKWKVTSLLTSEQEPDPEEHHSTLMEFEVDGVILLYNIRKGDIRERSIEIFKMRGTSHSARIFPMKVSPEGVTVFPEDTVF